MEQELRKVYDILKDYHPNTQIDLESLNPMVWIDLGYDQIEIEWLLAEETVDLPACYTVTVRAYAPHHGLSAETPIGSVYDPKAAVALVKWVLMENIEAAEAEDQAFR